MAGETTPALRRLVPYVRRSGRTIAVGLVCVVVTTAISLSGPWILKYAIDDLNLGVTRAKLGFYATLLLAAAVVGGLFRFLMRRIIIGASRVIEYEIRNDFFAALERQPLAYFQSHRTGDLMSRATNDLNAVRMMAGPAVMYSSSTLLVFIVAIILTVELPRLPAPDPCGLPGHPADAVGRLPRHRSTDYRVHVHVVPASSPEVAAMRGFRDALRADPRLRHQYAALKRAIVNGGPIDPVAFTKAKHDRIVATLGQLGLGSHQQYRLYDDGPYLDRSRQLAS